MSLFKHMSKTLCLFFAVVTAVLLLTAMPQKAEAADTNRYGYKSLETAAQKKAYEAIADALLAGASDVSLSQMNVTVDDFKKALNMVIADCAEIYWPSRYQCTQYSSRRND